MYFGMYIKPSAYELEGSFLFFRAIEQGDLKTIQSMMKIQPTMVFQRDEDGRTPLIYAAQKNLLQIVKIFLKAGVNQDAVSFR